MNRAALGILTTYPDGTSCRRPRWPQWRPFVELMRMGRAVGVTVYVFSPDDVDWANRRIYGYYCPPSKTHGRRWIVRAFPFPDAVYNRVPTRIAERHPAVRRTLRRFHAALSGRVYNPHYLNKAFVAKAIAKDAELNKYLPETALFTDGSKLQQFVHRHGRVYVKSIGGSLGNDIMQVSRGPSRKLLLRYNAGPQRTRIARHDGWRTLLEHVGRLMRGRKFVLQQGIRLARADNRPFDLRLLVQKNPAGHWEFTGGAARVAGIGQITTHVPRGGRRMAMSDALQKAFGAEAISLTERVEEVATKAASAVEAATGRQFVEMSLDVGVDVDGHPWIFELNAKPLHFDERDIQKRRNANLLNYVQALATGVASA